MMKKILLILVILTLVTSTMFSAATDLFTDSLGGFLTEVTDALPDSAVVGGTWSDAYIGQLIGIPPHFGIGIAGGLSRFPVASLKDAIAISGMKLPVDTLFLPNIAIEGRIGGFILPFDIGVRFGMIPSTTISDISFAYYNIGADVRYALLKEGLLKPDLSLGLGYTYSSGEIGYKFNAGALAGIDPSYSTKFGINTEGELATTFNTSVIEAKLQVSKSLILLTPYLGIAGYSAISTADYKVSTAIGSIKDSKDDNTYGARVFGGLSFNILLLKLDLSGMYNVMTENWGANFGTRIQL